MQFDLTGARNVHVVPNPSPGDHKHPSDVAERAPVQDFEGRVDRVTRSPMEELLARVQEYGGLVQLPEAVASLIVAGRKVVKVAANGIRFEHRNQSYHFYSPDSVTCHPSNVGQSVQVVFNRHDMNAVYVLDEQARFVEAVPLATHPKHFEKEMEEELKSYRRVLSHASEALKKTHAKTTREAAARAQTNREAIQFASQTQLPPEARAAAEESTEADELHQAMQAGERAASRIASRKKAVRQVDVVEALARRGGVPAEK